MTKLTYPEDGIYKLTNSKIVDAKEHLSSAKKCCNFSVPSSFAYRTYLQNLDELLDDYEKQMNLVLEKVKKVSENYELLETDLENDAKTIERTKLKQRERLIS